MEDYYETLGVEKGSSADQIKKKYRKLSMKHHPDRGGNKETFQKINTAYQILGDPVKKRNYDMQRENPLGKLFGQNGNADMGGFFNMFFGGQMPEGMGQPSVQIFRNGVPVQVNMQKRPPPIIKTIEISLEQAYKGINFPLEIERWIKDENTRRVEKEKIYIDIPRGIDDGEIVVLKNKGNINGEISKGDIKLHIKVINKTQYIRDGLDLLLNKKISLKQALLGFTFEIEHICGKSYKLNNTNGNIIKPFFSKTISGLGMIRDRKSVNGMSMMEGEMKGSLIISFEIEFPRNLTEEQKKKLNEIL
jgi:DnaJ-class molecular chaperone